MIVFNKNILTEDVEPQKITDSIKKRYEVKINYYGKNEKGSGVRLIQPVAYGVSKSGNPVIRAFQPFGDTKTRTPHWKLFRVDKITEWKPLRNRKFQEPPHSQWKSEGNFNPNGDKSMSNVYLVADFEGAKLRYNDNLKAHNKEVHDEKIKNDPLYDFKRNLKNSIKATPEIMKRIEDWHKQKNKNKNDNSKSVKEMSTISDFGNDNTQSTVGPIEKDNFDINNNNGSVRNDAYEKLKTGPVYK